MGFQNSDLPTAYCYLPTSFPCDLCGPFGFAQDRLGAIRIEDRIKDSSHKRQTQRKIRSKKLRDLRVLRGKQILSKDRGKDRLKDNTNKGRQV